MNGSPPAPPGLLVYDHLPAGELEYLIRRSAAVLARSGYSTVMDLARLGKKAIFIPTPGQTEQEYLGVYLAEKGLAVCLRQDRFSLREALDRARALAHSDWGPDAKKNTILGDEIRAILELSGKRGQAGGGELVRERGQAGGGGLPRRGDQSDAGDLG